MNSRRYENQVLQSPCVSTRLREEAAVVGEMRAASAIQQHLRGLSARVAERLRRISRTIPAGGLLARQFPP